MEVSENGNPSLKISMIFKEKYVTKEFGGFDKKAEICSTKLTNRWNLTRSYNAN